MMRNYNHFTPAPTRSTSATASRQKATPPKTYAKTIDQAMEEWTQNRTNASTDELEDQSGEGVSFQLKTDAGVLSYKPSEFGNYTDFLRVVIDMMLTFNASEVDPEFRKVIRKAFVAYESGDDFGGEEDNEDEDEDIDLLTDALENARSEGLKYEQGLQYISSLPKSEKLTLKILQSDSDSTNASRVEKLLTKMTDIPPNIMHKIVHNNEPFSLPFDKAADVYVQLRILGVILTAKTTESAAPTTTVLPTTTKKVSAAKKSIKKSTAKSGWNRVAAKKATVNINTKSKQKTIKPMPTGTEKLRSTVGIIKD